MIKCVYYAEHCLVETINEDDMFIYLRCIRCGEEYKVAK